MKKQFTDVLEDHEKKFKFGGLNMDEKIKYKDNLKNKNDGVDGIIFGLLALMYFTKKNDSDEIDNKG